MSIKILRTFDDRPENISVGPNEAIIILKKINDEKQFLKITVDKNLDPISTKDILHQWQKIENKDSNRYRFFGSNIIFQSLCLIDPHFQEQVEKKIFNSDLQQLWYFPDKGVIRFPKNENKNKIINSTPNSSESVKEDSSPLAQEHHQIKEDIHLRSLSHNKNLNGKTLKKIFVVDSSTQFIKAMNHFLSNEYPYSIVGNVKTLAAALLTLQKNPVDSLILDITLIENRNLDLINEVVNQYKIPVILLHSLFTPEDSFVIEALSLGAATCLQRPLIAEIQCAIPENERTNGETCDLATYQKMQIEKRSHFHEIVNALETTCVKTDGPNKNNIHRSKNLKFDHIQSGLILIGASTGGTKAIQDVLEALPNEIPPIVIVQHIPQVFSKALAERIDRLCHFRVKEASHAEVIRPNHVYIAPGGKQMKLIQVGSDQVIEINDDPPLNCFRPSVDYLFQSVLKLKINRMVGVILTGMGADGSKGLLELKKRGAKTIVQDEATCVVFGMPKAAIEIGAATTVAPLFDIAEKIILDYNRLK